MGLPSTRRLRLVALAVLAVSFAVLVSLILAESGKDRLWAALSGDATKNGQWAAHARYGKLPHGAWRHSSQWDAEMDAMVEKGCSLDTGTPDRLPDSFCKLFRDFDEQVEMARSLRGTFEKPRTISIVWATSDYGMKPPPEGFCEYDERFPPTKLPFNASFNRRPNPLNDSLFDPGPWFRCPIRCCHYPTKAEGGPLELAQADGIRFAFSALNGDRTAAERVRKDFAHVRPKIPTAIFSFECDVYHPVLRDRHFMEQFDFIAMYNLTADIPAYSLNAPELAERLGKITGSSKDEIIREFRSRNPRVLFLQGNCGSRSGREGVADDFLKRDRLDALGSCKKNKPWPEDLIGPNVHDNRNEKLYRLYRYSLSMENSRSGDYITEKSYNAIAVGTIPIYRGPSAPIDTHLRHFFPEGSVLFYDSFNGTDDLLSYLQRLDTDDEELWKRIKWRAAKKFGGGARLLWEVGKYSFECRMCLKSLLFRERDAGRRLNDTAEQNS